MTVQSEPESPPRELRALSPRAEASVSTLTALAHALGHHPLAQGAVITRPHPLLVMVRRGPASVLLCPGAVWDGGRELITP